jgi:hypothetical protein
VRSGQALPLKQKLTLLDMIVHKKEQFKDEHLKKLVQSDKYSIGRLVKNIQKRVKISKVQEVDNSPSPEKTNLPMADKMMEAESQISRFRLEVPSPCSYKLIRLAK